MSSKLKTGIRIAIKTSYSIGSFEPNFGISVISGEFQCKWYLSC